MNDQGPPRDGGTGEGHEWIEAGRETSPEMPHEKIAALYERGISAFKKDQTGEIKLNFIAFALSLFTSFGGFGRT